MTDFILCGGKTVLVVSVFYQLKIKCNNGSFCTMTSPTPTMSSSPTSTRNNCGVLPPPFAGLLHGSISPPLLLLQRLCQSPKARPFSVSCVAKKLGQARFYPSPHSPIYLLLNLETKSRDVTRVGETIAYSWLHRDLDDFGQSRLLVLVLQQQLAQSRLLVLLLQQQLAQSRLLVLVQQQQLAQSRLLVLVLQLQLVPVPVLVVQ